MHISPSSRFDQVVCECSEIKGVDTKSSCTRACNRRLCRCSGGHWEQFPLVRDGERTQLALNMSLHMPMLMEAIDLIERLPGAID